LATKQCFFLGLEGSDSILYHKGLAWLFENAKETGGWLAVNGRENIGGIARHPGLGRFAIFHNKNVHRVMIADCMIELVTRFLIPAEGLNKPLLAIHPTTDYLNALDAVQDVPKMMVIPWIAEEADAWAKKSFAKDFDNPELPSIFLDNVAVTAFKHLKFAFTESPPTSPVQYRTAICQTIHILIENGLRFEPAALESALVQQCGWGPVSAKHAAEIAEIFLAGQTPAGYDGTGPWNSDIIKLWKIEAKKTT
jgi:hypothetical protein